VTEGWAAIPNWIVRDPKVGPIPLAVYAVIQSHAGSKGTTALRHKTIAYEAGVSQKSVERAVATLKDLGVLWWEGRKTKEGFAANVYHPLQEQDEILVGGTHSPHEARTTVSPAGVDSQSNWAPENPHVSNDQVGLTVQQVPTQGRQGGAVTQTAGVPSQGRTIEEEPIEEELPTLEPASPWDELVVPEGWWSLSFRPHAEAYKAALANYPDADPYERTVAYITWSRAKGVAMTSSGWIRFMHSEQQRVEEKRREGAWGADDYRREREAETGMTIQEEMIQRIVDSRGMLPPGRASFLRGCLARGVSIPEQDLNWLNGWSTT
jgi:hypothetical protein